MKLPLRPWLVLSSSTGVLWETIWTELSEELRSKCLGVWSERQAPVVERARARIGGERVRKFEGAAALESELLAECKKTPSVVILCLGYMRILSADFLDQCRAPIFNSHPSLLPAFPGMDLRVHEQVFEKALLTGVSVHLVNEGLDAGPLVEVRSLPVDPGWDSVETLRARVREEEVKLWVGLLPRILASRLEAEDRHLTTRALQRKLNQEGAQ